MYGTVNLGQSGSSSLLHSSPWYCLFFFVQPFKLIFYSKFDKLKPNYMQLNMFLSENRKCTKKSN